jgi:hypothetical protein
MPSNIVGYEWPFDGTKRIAFVSGDDHIHELVERGNRWIDTDLTRNTNAPTIPLDDATMTGYVWSQGHTQQIDYVSADDSAGRIRELVQLENHSWNYEDVMDQYTGAPPADGTTLVGYSWQGNGTKHIVYTSSDGHVHELITSTVGGWQYTHITEQAHGSVAEGATLAAFAWESNVTRHVGYISSDGHIHEVVSGKDNIWKDTDITAHTGTPEAGEDSPIVGYAWDANNTRSFVYIADDGRVYALVAGTDDKWQSTDLIAQTNAPKAFGVALTGYVWTTSETQQIVYISADRHIQELSAGRDGTWSHIDVTQATHAPIAQNDVIVGFEWTASSAKQIIYLDTAENPHLHELMLTQGGTWRHTDITKLTGASDLV